MAYVLSRLGRVATLQGHPEHAARLFGAAEALREAAGGRWHFPEDYAEQLSAVRGRMTRAPVAAAWAAGRAMPADEAVAYALGQMAVSPPEAAAPPAAAVQSESPPGGLTAREVEIARLVARGLTYRKVARTLHITADTVDKHLQNITNKLCLDSRKQLAAWAYRNGLID